MFISLLSVQMSKRQHQLQVEYVDKNKTPIAIYKLQGNKLIKFAMKLFRKILEKSNADTSISQFLCSLIKGAMYVLLVFIIASYCGVDAASIVALLGSAGVAIGLAVQGSLSNMAGGVLILLLKPFKLGDYIIDAAGNEGVVDEIHVIYTKLRTPDNKVIIFSSLAFIY